MGTLAETVLAPTEGNIQVVALSTTATAAIDLGSTVGAYFTFISDVDCWLIFGPTNAGTAPVGTATTGNARAWLLPAKTPLNLHIRRNSRYLRAIAGGAGFLRIARSSD